MELFLKMYTGFILTIITLQSKTTKLIIYSVFPPHLTLIGANSALSTYRNTSQDKFYNLLRNKIL